jgi:hypothetical protein
MKTKVNKTAPQTKPRVNVITLGCSKNIHDSEVLMGQLRGNNMDVVHESDLFLTIFGILIFHEVCFAKCLKSHLQNLAADFSAS